jgi:DNA-binding response OmpR family regulator
MFRHKILIADDDADIHVLLRNALEFEGFATEVALNGNDALSKARDPDLSLVLLDIIMPDMSGFNICRQIRDSLSIPIVFLTAKDREIDKILGLEVGADDYITKPFSVDEVVARIKAHLRREARKKREMQASSAIQIGDLTINKDTFEVRVKGEPVVLSTKEFQILAYLVENKNRVLSREQIYEAIWGYNDFRDINTVTVHLKNIRSKIDPDHTYIKTVWGAGYKFVG